MKIHVPRATAQRVCWNAPLLVNCAESARVMFTLRSKKCLRSQPTRGNDPRARLHHLMYFVKFGSLVKIVIEKAPCDEHQALQ